MERGNLNFDANGAPCVTGFRPLHKISGYYLFSRASQFSRTVIDEELVDAPVIVLIRKRPSGATS